MTEQATIEPNTAASAPPAPAAVVQPPAPPAAPSGTEPAASAPKTLIDGDAGDDGDGKPVAIPADWPADWRDKLAGEDKSKLKKLTRYASPADIYKALEAASAKIASGEVKKALPDNPTEKELADWRKDNGIPEKAGDYKIEPPRGYVFGDADKPILDTFTAHAHSKNWNAKQLNEAVAWYVDHQETVKAQIDERDSVFHNESEDALRQEWGPEYRANLNSAKALVLQYGDQELYNEMISGRTASGRKYGDHAKIWKLFANIARELNPAHAHVPQTTGSPMKGVDDRIAEIRKLRQENPDKYDADKGLQAEELKLIEASMKMKSRAA